MNFHSRSLSRDFAEGQITDLPIQVRLFRWLAIPLCLAFALLTPPFQTPDEHQHLFRAWQLSDLRLKADRRDNKVGGILPGGLAIAAEPEIGTLKPHVEEYRDMPVKRPLGSLNGTGVHESKPRFLNFLGAAIYSPAGYLPQILVIWTGRLTGMSVEGIILLGRIANALLFVGIFGYAIRITPWGRTAFLFVGLLPTTFATSASFGQDGLVISLSGLIVALGLKAALRSEMTTREFTVAAAAALGLALTKMVYLPALAVAGLFGPRTNAGQVKQLIVLAAIGVGSMLLLTAWLSFTSDIRVLPLMNLEPVGARFMRFLGNPAIFFSALINLFTDRGDLLAQGLTTFGWLNVGPVRPALLLIGLALLAAVLAGGPDELRPSPAFRLWLALVAAGTLTAVCFALWLYYTPVQYDSINGVQARYLLPIALIGLPALIPYRAFTPRALAGMLWLLGASNFLCLTVIVKTYYVL